MLVGQCVLRIGTGSQQRQQAPWRDVVGEAEALAGKVGSRGGSMSAWPKQRRVSRIPFTVGFWVRVAHGGFCVNLEGGSEAAVLPPGRWS